MGVSLVSGVFLWSVLGLGLALVVWSLFPLNRHRGILIAVVGAVSLAVTLLSLHEATVAGWIVPALPLKTQVWAWAAFFAIGWAFVGWRSGHRRSRVVGTLAVPASFVMALALFNAYFYFIPTFGGLLGQRPADQVNVAQTAEVNHFLQQHEKALHHHTQRDQTVGSTPPALTQAELQIRQSELRYQMFATKMRTANHGIVIPVHFRPTVSHFQAMNGYVYLPPAWWGNERSQLPVIEFIGGTPSTPKEWLRSADVQGAGDQVVAANHGKAPIMVMIDDNGSFTSDSECVDRPGNLAETYALVDVRDTMVRRFHVTADPQKWGIAGLSEGGTCALAIGLRHSADFNVIGDFGGGPKQTLATPQETLQKLFGGSVQAQNAYDPNILLKQPVRKGLSAMFVVGNEDGGRGSIINQAAAAKAAGINTQLRVVPGGHTYRVWGLAAHQFVPFAYEILSQVHPSKA